MQPDDPLHLLNRQAFAAPAYLAPSAWTSHIPFAFWLASCHRPRVFVELGTHFGVSYFAFCQALAANGLATRAYAVDHWKGDDHAGRYGEDVFAAVKRHNDNQFAAFSRLVRSDFEAAAGHFEPGSIDLLHIDGHHAHESVQRDFETWQPLLSARAIVLFHDTNVRERGFGVGPYFRELGAAYPHFEFIHGHGLGVLFVGPDVAPEVARLHRLGADPQAAAALRDAFAALGSSWDKSWQLMQPRPPTPPPTTTTP
jgi:hypothetical protein